MKTKFLSIVVILFVSCNSNWGRYGGYRLEYESALDYRIVLDKGKPIYAPDSIVEAKRKGTEVKFLRPSGKVDTVLIGKDGDIIESFVDKSNLSFNEKFILIDQKPRDKICLTSVYSECKIALKNSHIHQYWIIDQIKDCVYGPLTKNQFLITKKKLKVPAKLTLNLE